MWIVTRSGSRRGSSGAHHRVELAQARANYLTRLGLEVRSDATDVTGCDRRRADPPLVPAREEGRARRLRQRGSDGGGRRRAASGPSASSFAPTRAAASPPAQSSGSGHDAAGAAADQHAATRRGRSEVAQVELVARGSRSATPRGRSARRSRRSSRSRSARTSGRGVSSRSRPRPRSSSTRRSATTATLGRRSGRRARAQVAHRRHRGDVAANERARGAGRATRSAKSRVTQSPGGTVLTTYAKRGESCSPGSRSTRSPISTRWSARLRDRAAARARQARPARRSVSIDAGGGRGRRSPASISWISSQAEFTPTPIQTRDERADLVYAIKIRVANAGRHAQDRHAGRRAVRRGQAADEP